MIPNKCSVSSRWSPAFILLVLTSIISKLRNITGDLQVSILSFPRHYFPHTETAHRHTSGMLQRKEHQVVRHRLLGAVRVLRHCRQETQPANHLTSLSTTSTQLTKQPSLNMHSRTLSFAQKN